MAKSDWYNQRLVALALAIIAFVGAYVVGLHALDTARNVAYLALFVLIIFGLNRLVKAIRG